MPKQRKKELIQCEYFHWKLGCRRGVYFADGRSGNRQDLGRHSLGTRDINNAREKLKELDEQKALETGRITQEELRRQGNSNSLTIHAGWSLYYDHLKLPRVAFGVRPATIKRYRAVFDKFLAFSCQRQVQFWNDVNKGHLGRYVSWLENEGFAYRSTYLEATTIIQCANWLSNEGHLPKDYKLVFPLRKAQGTNTYCWTEEQVTAMVLHCRKHEHLQWLSHVIVALATSGMRISELASLQWSDVDLKVNSILLKDETAHAKNIGGRTTKSGRNRSFPLHPDLKQVFQKMLRSCDGLVFHGPHGGRIKPDTIRNIFVREVLKPLADRFPSVPNGSGFLKGRLHSFRHFFCSQSANQGVPELLVGEWLGHKDSDMIRHYYHQNNQYAQRHMNQLRFIDLASGNCADGSPGVKEAVADEG